MQQQGAQTGALEGLNPLATMPLTLTTVHMRSPVYHTYRTETDNEKKLKQNNRRTFQRPCTLCSL